MRAPGVHATAIVHPDAVVDPSASIGPYTVVEKGVRIEFIGRRDQFDFFARFKVSRNLNVFLDVINLLEENRGRYSGLYREDRRAQTNLFPRSISTGVQARF